MKRKLTVCLLLAGLVIALCAAAFAYTPDGTEKRPYETTAQISEGLRKAVLEGKTEVTFRFHPSLYDKISSRDSMNGILLKGTIVSANWKYTDTQCTVYGIEAYPDMIFCSSEQDILNALAKGEKELSLALDAKLFAGMSSNGFSALYKLEGSIGITDRAMKYYSNGVILYSDMEYAGNFVKCETYEKLKRAVILSAKERAEEIVIFLSDDLFGRINSSKDDYQDIFSDCAVLDANYYTNSGSNLLIAENIDYYPGFDIVFAVRNGLVHTLSDPERQLYELALQITDEVRQDAAGAENYEEFVIEALTREIAKRVTYQKYGDYYNDTAIGALLRGRCDCDGYADAFYLLASLLGLEVGHQTGDSLPLDGDSAHMWNVVKINGRWYTHDATWCDTDNRENPGRINTAWIGLGSDMAKRYYTWNEDAAVYELSSDSEAFKGVFWHVCETEEDVLDAMASGRKQLHLHAGQALYKRLTANNFRAFYELEGRAGIMNAEMSYNKNLISIWDIGYAPVFFYCETEEDILKAFSGREAGVTLCLSESLYSRVTANGFRPLFSLEEDAGVGDREMYYYEAKRLFIYENIEYR